MAEKDFDEVKRKYKGNAPVGVRLTPEDRALFDLAAERDGKRLPAWLRWLAHRRVKWQEEKSEQEGK